MVPTLTLDIYKHGYNTDTDINTTINMNTANDTFT